MTMITKKENNMENKLMAPLSTLQWISRDKLKPNSYNPNKVSRENLNLLIQSILSNGWTLPLVVRPDFTIIDGFHRWTVAGEEPLKTQLKNKVPIVIVKHKDEAGDMYGTVTHNRARGTHLLEPMKNIVKKLMEQGKSVKEIGKELGMRPEEVFRLSDLSKDHFLKMMASRTDGYSKEVYLRKM
jgi:ParB-like chromosome segregation protein Spo0J